MQHLCKTIAARPLGVNRQPGCTLGGHLQPRAARLGTTPVVALVLALAWALAACGGSLLPKPTPAPARFTLDDGSAAAPGRAGLPARAGTGAGTGTGTGTGTGAAAAADAAALAGAAAPAAGAPDLVVAVPRAAAGYDSTRMVYLQRPQELQAFAFHEWADTPAQMLAPLLVRALQGSGTFRAVLLAPTAATSALRLETQIIRLQHDFTSQPSRVRLTLQAVLLDSTTRQVLAAREFDETVPAQAANPVAGAAAAQQATQQVLSALAAFCAVQIQR